MDIGQIILFHSQGGETNIVVRFANETMLLIADTLTELFRRDQ